MQLLLANRLAQIWNKNKQILEGFDCQPTLSCDIYYITSAETKKAMDKRAICCITGALMINLTLGTFYSIGNIVGYIVSYMRNHGNPDVTVEQGVWFTGTFLFGQGAFIIVGSYLERNYSSRVACIFGCCIHCLSNYLSVWAINQSFFTLVLVFGLGSGIGCGSAYVAAIIAAQKWFPQNKGFFTGLIVAGFGAGGLISTMLQTAYVNPYNTTPDESGYFGETVYEKVPSLFLYTAIIFTVIQGIGCLLAFPPPHSGSVDQQTNSTEQQPSIVDESTLPEMRAISSAFRYKIFYVIGFMMMLVCPGVSFVVTMGKAFGQVFINDDRFLARILAFAAVANALGRLTWGSLADRFSFSVCFSFKVILFTALIVTFPFEFVLDSKAMYSIWVLGLFFGFSGTFVLFPVFIEQVFGAKFHGTVYGLLYLLLATSSLLTSLVIQMTLAKPNNGQASSTEKLSTRLAPCAIIGALYVVSLMIYLFAIPVRRLENAIMRRKEVELMKNRNSLFNRVDLFPSQRKNLAEKTIGSGAGLTKENSLGSIVRFSDQPTTNQVGSIKAVAV